MSGLGEIMVSLDRFRLRRAVPTLMDMFGYTIGWRMDWPSSVNSRCGFGDAAGEGLRGGRGDAVWVFVDVSCDGSSLGLVCSCAGE